MRVRLCGFGLGVCHSLLLGGADFDTVPTRKSNYTKPVFVCQGDLALFTGQFRGIFGPVLGLFERPVLRGLWYYTKVVGGCQGKCGPEETRAPDAQLLELSTSELVMLPGQLCGCTPRVFRA